MFLFLQTTSLYELLGQHPLVVKAKRRETHFFDWRWNKALTTAEDQLTYYMNFFEKAALHKHPSLCSGESTPSYLLHRAYSQYQMCRDTSGTPEQLQVRGQSAYKDMSFEEIIEKEIAELEAAGIEPDSSFELFQRTILQGLPMGHGGHSIVARGLYVLQLQPWMEAFSNYQIMVMGSRDIQGDRQKVRKAMTDVYGFLGLRPHDIEDVSAKNTRAYEPMSTEGRERLTAFYEPYNNKLWEMLGRVLEW
eukprot:gene3704-7366_t